MDRKYEPVKIYHGWYFTEYRPPINNWKFASLNLVILQDSYELSDVISAMENELILWLRKYPIPLFVSAFNNKGDVIELKSIKSCNHLLGFLENGSTRLFWRLVRDEEIPDVALNQEYIDKLFDGLKFRTYQEIHSESASNRRKIRLGWLIFFIWLVIIPATAALLEYFSDTLSLLVLVYSLYKAIRKGLELTGKLPKSKKEKEKEIEASLKDHYYYHCQMNPEGFNKLKLENLEKMEKENIAKEAELLKSSQIS